MDKNLFDSRVSCESGVIPLQKAVHKRNSISYSFLILFPDLILCLLLCLTKHVIFGRDGTRRKSLRPGRMSQKDRRLLKMILVIFVSFLVCYLPITIVKVIQTPKYITWRKKSEKLLSSDKSLELNT